MKTKLAYCIISVMFIHQLWIAHTAPHSKNNAATFTTAQSGYSDETSTFQENALPTSADIVTIRPGDTLKVRNHFYCKDIVFQTSGSVQSVLQCANLSFIHKGQ